MALTDNEKETLVALIQQGAPHTRLWVPLNAAWMIRDTPAEAEALGEEIVEHARQLGHTVEANGTNGGYPPGSCAMPSLWLKVPS